MIVIKKENATDVIVDEVDQEVDPVKNGAIVEKKAQDRGIGIDLRDRTEDLGQEKEDDDRDHILGRKGKVPNQK